MIMMTGILFAACAPAKKIPPANTKIENRPTVKTPPVKEKIVKPVVVSNPNAKMAPITGRWKFESSSEKDFSIDPNAMPELSFNEAELKVSGSTGCNTFNGFFFTTGDQFNFSPLAVKLKRCADASLEKYLTGFYKMVGYYKTDGSKVYLYHKNDRGRYVVFSKLGR